MKKLFFFLVASLLSIGAVAQNQPANTDVYYARRASLFQYLPITKHDIVFLGNSLTDGCEFNELFNNRHIKNRGIVGDIVQGLIDRIDPILKGKPKKIFILSGVNDVSHGVSVVNVAPATEKLIVLIKQHCPKTKIYLQSMLPFNNDVRMWKNLKDREQVVVDGNKALEQVAARQHVTWINLYPLFVNSEGKLRPELTNDGLHLMGEGYLIWRDALKPYVK